MGILYLSEDNVIVLWLLGPTVEVMITNVKDAWGITSGI
jgi:hypothetical protein